MAIFDSLIAWITTLPEAWIYLVLALSACLENLFPPIPGDTITALGAFLVGARGISFWWVYATTTLGSVGGFACLFVLARRFGRAYFKARSRGPLRISGLEKAEKLFQRYGLMLVLLNRFFPGIRSAIAVVAGLAGLSVARVLALASLSAAVWNLGWIWAGYTLGDNWQQVRETLGRFMSGYNRIFLLALCGAVALWLARRILQKKKIH